MISRLFAALAGTLAGVASAGIKIKGRMVDASLEPWVTAVLKGNNGCLFDLALVLGPVSVTVIVAVSVLTGRLALKPRPVHRQQRSPLEGERGCVGAPGSVADVAAAPTRVA